MGLSYHSEIFALRYSAVHRRLIFKSDRYGERETIKSIA